jgi:L-2-hydroxyglutarate oxidase
MSAKADRFDVIVIGGGIVGLSTAYQLLLRQPNLKLMVIEKELKVGAHQTSHNSGVIHSGIYYKPGSLKALNCIRGYELLLQFCEQYGIAYDLCGKVIVATKNSEIPSLEELKRRGEASGLQGLRDLSPQGIQEIEPNCVGVRGLYVPQTGIICYRQVAEKLEQLLHEMGASIVLGARVIDILKMSDGIEVQTEDGSYISESVINCAGLFCDRIALLTEEVVDVRIIPFRGEYYQINESRKDLIRHLIYPVPNPNFPFLGVHFTRMMGGGVEVGPNAVLGFCREGYKKSDFELQDIYETFTWPGFHKIVRKYWRDGLHEIIRSYSKHAFLKAAQELVPAIQEDDLIPGGSGVRAQACHKNGQLVDDFLIIERDRMIHLLNAPSPAATASLAIGESLAQKFLTIRRNGAN